MNTERICEQAIAAYHEWLARDESLTPAFLARLRSGMKSLHLLCGERPPGIALRPHLLTRAQYNTLTEGEARSVIYRAFMNERFPVKLMKSVHREFFIAPIYDEFKPQTLWSLENAFTTSFKELQPVRQYEMTAKLGKFLKPYTQN